jgi:hypothetical protein
MYKEKIIIISLSKEEALLLIHKINCLLHGVESVTCDQKIRLITRKGEEVVFSFCLEE